MLAASNTSTMPGWLEWWARRQPLSKTTEAVRALMLGGPTAGPVTASLLRAADWAASAKPSAFVEDEP